MKNDLQAVECVELKGLDDFTKRQIMALHGGFDLRAQWFSTMRVKSNSLKTYERALAAFERYCAANAITRLDSLTPQMLYDFADNFLSEKSTSTRALYLQAARRFIAFLHANGFLQFNIAANLKMQGSRQYTPKKDYLNAESAANLIAAQNGGDLNALRNKAIIALMITGGLRVCEIHNASLADFDNLHGERILYVLGKGRVEKSDYVKIAAPVEKIINDYLQARVKSGELLDDSSPLFATHGNKFKSVLRALSTRAISFIVKNAMRKNGINSRRFTAHSLRHTAAVLSLKGGATLADTMLFMRHKNISTTQIYSHSIELEKNDSARRIAAAVFA